MSKQTRPLSGRVVAITGGARGIGRATAEALVRKGARVAIGDVDLALAESTAAELGGGVVALPLDVTDRDSFAAFLDGAGEQLGPVDVLINNAGIMPIGPFTAESDAIAQRIVDINLHGVLLGCKLALEGMLPRGSGHIVNVASQAGKAGFAGGATYCASKHAVVGLTTSLADELAGTGVDVSCVMPAIVKTELSAGMAASRFVKPVEPEDVADAIVAALEHPRLNVHVPKAAAVTAYVGMLPVGARRRLERLFNAEQALLKADPAARAGYEARAAVTDPEAARGSGRESTPTSP
jgi:NAD(P)-dependent dehydrogenase (short-subunit alcohol dehydrogenase family)